MKKKTRLIIASIGLLLVLTGTIALANLPTPQDEMMDMLNRMENALGDEWKKQIVTKVSDLVYSDDEGNTIVYYVCTTTYYETDTTQQSGLWNCQRDLTVLSIHRAWRKYHASLLSSVSTVT